MQAIHQDIVDEAINLSKEDHTLGTEELIEDAMANLSIEPATIENEDLFEMINIVYKEIN